MKEWKHEKAGTNTPPINVPYTSPGTTICKENCAIRKLKEKREHIYALIGQTHISILERQRDINTLYNRIEEVNRQIKNIELMS